jgi:hypothetical protein
MKVLAHQHHHQPKLADIGRAAAVQLVCSITASLLCSPLGHLGTLLVTSSIEDTASGHSPLVEFSCFAVTAALPVLFVKVIV